MSEKRPLTHLRVRAIQNGYYGHDENVGAIYRYEGDVFTITPRVIAVTNKENNKPVVDAVTGEPKTRILSCEDQFSSNWMEPVTDDTPEKLTTAQEGTNRQTAERNRRGAPANRAVEVEA